ncbi:hypothetical protein ACOSP6_12090 [Tenacibaculum sp. MEBiC06402]|uniref:hypothetical protein n=1 Tax=unclassified Tenacibaculum TaxID=2635139 RepID=UPI003B99BAC7
MKNIIKILILVFTYQVCNSQTNYTSKKFDVIIPYCGIENDLDELKDTLGSSYFAVYQNKDYHNWDNFQIKKYNPKQSPLPKFLIKGLKLKDNTFTTGKWINRMFYPGESMSFTVVNIKNEENNKSYYIYAKGKLIETKQNEFPYFSKLKDYELIVVSTRDKIKQNIRKMDIPSWSAGGFEGGVFIYWIGDINGDYKLDMLIGTSSHYAFTEISLLLSNDDQKLFIEYKAGGCSSD